MKTLSFEKFKGLQVQANSFGDSQGFFEVADNVVISRDDIVSKRRGYRSAYYMQENIAAIADFQDTNFAIGNHIYRFNGTATGTVSTTAGSEIITVFRNDHGIQDGDWITDFVVNEEEVVAAFPLRYSDIVGQLQIAATGANDFTVTAADNATASATGTASWSDYTMLTGDLFHVGAFVPSLKTGKNLYWGADEGLHCIETIDGPVRKAGVAPALDTDAYLSGTSGGVAPNCQVAYRVVFGRKDANNTVHLSAPSDAIVLANPPEEITSGGLSLATGTNVLTITNAGHGLVNGDTVYLYNVVATPSGAIPPDGSSVAVQNVAGSSFDIDLDNLAVTPTAVTSLEYSTRNLATIYASIPSEIASTEYFFQVYRSDSVDAEVIPDARYKLVEQITLTAADLARGFIAYEDELPFEIIQSNQELYTNPTQEGETQANNRPPLAEDLALFKGYTFFGNCTAYRTLALSLVSTTNLTSGDVITLAGSDYVLRGDATNSAVGNDITTSNATGAAGTVTVTQVAHGLLADDSVYIIDSTIGVTEGLYTIAVPTVDTFTFASAATGSGTVTFEAREATGGAGIVTLTEPSGTAAETIAESIDFTARSLVKAVNRNSSSLVYAQYVSGVDESPGRILLTAKALDAAAFYATASSANAGGCFNPVLPTSGTAVADFQDTATNALFCSKYLEAEAVPIVNRFPIGSQDADILRIVALRDSLVIFKEDGVFRLNGDSLQNFTATALDTTVILKAQRSVAVLNNSVYALTNQGVVQVTDTSVRIISRQIEPLLTAVIGKPNLDAFTSGYAIESERLYILSTLDVNTDPSSSNIAYVFNYLTGAWTTWRGQSLAHSGFVDPNDVTYHVLASDRFDVMQLRRNTNKIDYTGQDAAVQCYIKTLASATAIAGTTTVCIDAPGHSIIAGDVITISSANTLLTSAFTGASDVDGLRTVVSVTDKIICFAADTNASSSTTGTLYWQRGISELSLAAFVNIGEKNIVCATLVPHGLSTGDAVNVDSVDSNMAGAFAADTDYLGYRPVVVLTDTTFYVKANNVATSGAIGTISVRDKRGLLTTLTIAAVTRPQPGDALVSNSKIYRLTDVEAFDGVYICTIDAEARFTSKSLVYLHAGYTSRIKFAPITMGTGTLKQFAEFQCWFRNSIACSQVNVGFSTDSRYSDKVAEWSTFVGTPAGFVSFGGWGSQKWGAFPWGGGTNVELDFETGPAVPLRTWVPQKSYLATFIQPELVHSTAGEPIELQSVTLIGKEATQKVSK